MAIFIEETRKFLCECGCGTEINPWSTWAKGHNMRTLESRENSRKLMLENNPNKLPDVDLSTLPKFYCECGCGEVVRPFCDYVRGHNIRGDNPMWNPEVAEKSSESHSGCFLSEEHKLRISEGNRERFKDPRERKKISDALFGTVMSDEARRAMRESWTDEKREEYSMRCAEDGNNWRGGHFRLEVDMVGVQ